jgi:small subunit ribosomal protein S4e
LAKKGGDTKLKRQLAPAFWEINRKEKRFAITIKPGPHAKQSSYPLAIILRDILHVTETLHEVEKSLNKGLVMLDGKIVRDPHRAVGLMDVIEIVPSQQSYRLVPTNGKRLFPILINNNEKNLKLAKITSRVTIPGGKNQYGFHDGKTLLSTESYKVGETCLIEMPKLLVRDHVPLEKGSIAVVTRGENVGSIGQIQEVRDGLFSLPKRLLISISERIVELPASIVMAVGSSTAPLIQVAN